MTENKSYLGDGAYVDAGRYPGEVVITAEDGVRATDTVVLGVEEIRRLIEWLEDQAGLAPRDRDYD